MSDLKNKLAEGSLWRSAHLSQLVSLAPDINWKRAAKWTLGTVAVAGLGYGAHYEMNVASPLMSRYYGAVVKGYFGSRVTNETPPANSAVDHRLGYDVIPQARESAAKHNDHITPQKKWQQFSFLWKHHYPIFDRPLNPGLMVSDASGEILYNAKSFRPAPYQTFDEVPVIIQRLATNIEDKNLLDFDSHQPSYNCGVDILRTGKAAAQQMHLWPGKSGGSGMAVQKIKQLSSKDGRTHGIFNKLEQIDAASIDTYRYGADTTERCKTHFLQYINLVPMSGHALTGELIGLREGMAVVFGNTTYDSVLRKDWGTPQWENPQTAKAFRQVLTLMKSWEGPAANLQARASKGEKQPRRWETTQKRINEVYLPKFVADGVITQSFADMVAKVKLDGTQLGKNPALPVRPASEKFILSMNNYVANYIGLSGDDRLFRMDRFDMSVRSTLYGDLNQKLHDDAVAMLDPKVAAEKGLMGEYRFNEQNVGRIVRGVTAIAQTDDGRWVTRISTDTYPGALDLNKGGKVSFGSIEKWEEGAVRLVLTQRLHSQLTGKTPEQLAAMPIHREDALTSWGVKYMLDPAKDHSLDGMLTAVRSEMDYSGTPRSYFTGGGRWTPQNFKNIGAGKTYNMNTALAGSINAAWARIAYDNDMFITWNVLGTPQDIFNPNSADPKVQEARINLMNRFTHEEDGVRFMERADKLMTGMDAGAMLRYMAGRTSGSATSLGVLLYSMKPDASYDEMVGYIKDNFQPSAKAATLPDDKKLAEIHALSAPRRMVDIASVLIAYGATAAQLQDRTAAGTEQLANLLRETPPPAKPDVRWFSRTEQLAALYGVRHPGSELPAMRDFIRSHTADKKQLNGVDFKALHKRYESGKYDPSARFYRFDLNDRVGLAFPKGTKRPQSAYAMLLVKQRLAHPGISIDEATAASYADHVEMDKWRRRPSQVRAQNRAITIALQKAASIEVQNIKRSWGYPYQHKAYSLARVLGVEGNSAEGVANFLGTMLNGGHRVSLARFDQLEFAPQAKDPNNPHPTTIVTNGRTNPQVVDPLVAKHTLLLGRNSVEDPNGTFRRLYGVFTYPDGSPLEVACKSGTNGESSDANARRANSAGYVRGAFGACTLGPKVVVVMQNLLFDAGPKDRFTSSVAAGYLLAGREAIQKLLDRTYSGHVPGSLAPKPVKPALPPYRNGKPAQRAADLFTLPPESAVPAFILPQPDLKTGLNILEYAPPRPQTSVLR